MWHSPPLPRTGALWKLNTIKSYNECHSATLLMSRPAGHRLPDALKHPDPCSASTRHPACSFSPTMTEVVRSLGSGASWHRQSEGRMHNAPRLHVQSVLIN